MSQSTTHACANCGSAVPENMRFCPNCGVPTGAEASHIAPAPPMYPAQQQTYRPAQQQQAYQAPLQGPPPAYARPQKNSGRSMLKVGLILLLVLLILGTAGFFALRYISSKGSTAQSGGTNNGATPTQAALTTTPINSAFIYASVTITVINAQQATSFADDHNTPAQGVVRLNLHAVQTDVNDVYSVSAPVFSYPETFTLLLPGGNKVTTAGYKDLTGPARKEDQTTWLDFPAPTGLKVDQMTLIAGKDTEEQIQVPLTGHADLSAYKAKQSTPDTRVQFGSLIWTLKTVTFKLSDSGTQVQKGQRFLVLSFAIDNPGTEGLNAFPPDYIRLQYGGTTIALEQAVIGDAAAGTSNIPGQVSFLVPQDTTSATFILLPGHTPGATNQATIPVQIS